MPKLIRITTVPISLKILLRGQHRYMTKQGFEVVGVSASGTELDDVRKTESIRTVALNMTRAITPWHDLKSIWQFYRLCKKEKPLIVHSHTPKAGLVGMLGAKLAGVPIRLHTVAGLPLMETSGIKRKVLNTVEMLTYRCAKRVYPNSVGLYDIILKNKLASIDKLKVIANGSSNGIDTTFFSSEQVSAKEQQTLRQEIGLNEHDFVFVFIGRMVGDKGINELVAAMSAPELSQPSIKLLLVGPLEPELDPLRPETLKEMNTNLNIISVGFQKDVRPYYAIAHALVFPSYREGFPNVVMQAGAMGLPAIVSDINGCNEIVVDGKNGIIVPPKKVAPLQQAMIRMMSDSTYYAQLKSHSRAMITSRYEQHVVWNALLTEYKQLLKENKLI